VQQLDEALLENPGSNSAQHVVAPSAFEDNIVHTV
jgi:hypothetical protein